MPGFDMSEMQEMQKTLQEKYKHKWESICPEIGQNKLLWMIGEIGEVIDIVKKNGGNNYLENAETRAHLIEEMADVLMYYNDVMLCYNITEEELKEAYVKKFEKIIKRMLYLRFAVTFFGGGGGGGASSSSSSSLHPGTAITNSSSSD